MLLRNGKIVKIGKAEDVGTEYIHQNMSDEEKRLVDDAKKKAAVIPSDKDVIPTEVEGSKSQKVAEITKVEFLDKDGNIKNVFETGDDISVRVYFKQNKKVEVLNFGVAIFNQENNYIFGINTVIDKIDTQNYIKDGFFEVRYKAVPLKNNSYYIKAGIFGENDNIIYDFLNKSNLFKIVSKSKNQGSVELAYDWR